MDWTMVGAIGEVGAAVIVLVSLIYLSLQVRATNRIALAEAWRAAAHKGSDFTSAAASDPAFRQTFSKVEGLLR